MNGGKSRAFRLFTLGAVVGAFLAALAGNGSCRGSPQGTALFLLVTFDESAFPPLYQLRFSGKDSSGNLIFQPALRPEPNTSGPLKSPQSVRILLADSLNDQLLSLGVDGLLESGEVVAEALAQARARKDQEVEVDVTLTGAGDPKCGTCSGCCLGVVCVSQPTVMGCGSANSLCSSCNSQRADGCPNGICLCGAQKECSPEQGADRCVAAECLCGTIKCQPGERCENGQCICTPLSCPGGCCSDAGCVLATNEAACGAAGLPCEACSSGQNCIAGVCTDCPSNCPAGCCSGESCYNPGISTCGASGAACTWCDSVRSDRCVNGNCACGDGGSCGLGLHCDGGRCACDSVSCPTGCCTNGTCEQPQYPSCRTGNSCVICDPFTSDRCAPGCSCGTTGQCAPGLQCVGGVCRCTQQSCSDGCCIDDVTPCYRVKNDSSRCGSAGLRCQPCDAGISCVNGACTSCTPGNCLDCCSGPDCISSGRSTCGINAASCVYCDPLVSNGCLPNGTCGCGSGPACRAGLECSSATNSCVCTSRSCPAGCCDANGCQPRTVSTCGIDGGVCLDCRSFTTDVCSASGNCQCGSRDGGCAVGQHCVNGQCVCDSQSCSSGCCTSLGTCVSPSLTACGPVGTGAACPPCDPRRADGCRGGRCTCGNANACSSNRVCDGGTCH
jgi:hypothetical protein